MPHTAPRAGAHVHCVYNQGVWYVALAFNPEGLATRAHRADKQYGSVCGAHQPGAGLGARARIVGAAFGGRGHLYPLAHT